MFVVKEHDGLIERWKRKNMENLLELHNKTPVWNEGQSSLLFPSSFSRVLVRTICQNYLSCVTDASAVTHVVGYGAPHFPLIVPIMLHL